MRIRIWVALLLAVTLTAARSKHGAAPGTAAHAKPGGAHASDTTARPPDPIWALVANLQRIASERDSLTVLADKATGASRDFLEELIWQRHLDLQAGMLDLAEKIATLKEKGETGRDVTDVIRALNAGVRDEWPRYKAQIQRRERAMLDLTKAADEATGAQRVAIESQLTAQSERLLQAYQGLVDVLLALEPIGVDMSGPRAYVLNGTRSAAEGLVTRIQLARRDQAAAGARLSRDASNADLRYAFEAADERLKRASHGLAQAIRLMDRVGMENTDLRVALIASTGRMTTDIFKGKVLLGVLKTLGTRLVDFLAGKAPQWLFQGALIVLTFFAFRALARLARAVARRAAKYSQSSELMQSTIVRLAGNGVMIIGFLVILTQLGVQIAPLLAGLGIAGFVVGFALQNTLSNFAAGGMILGNHPYDLGDEIEVAGATGIVKHMSLVSTTILTPDNQTLIVPNSTIWGGVIRNRTAQAIRRVDLMFGIDYGDNVEEAERVLREIVAGHEHVMRDPAPVIRLHQLADSSVNFIVRAWTGKDRYWDVYWDLTRAVKLRFDQEGISIPFPQRDVHLKGGGATAGGGERKA